MEKLANKLDISVASLYNYRSGKVPVPIDLAFRLEDLYKIPARDWVTAA